MGLLDELKNKVTEMISEPEQLDQIKQLAEEKGISLEEAKNKFLPGGDKPAE